MAWRVTGLEFWAEGVQARVVTTDLNTLLTALYVRIDDDLAGRVRVGRRPRLTDSELLTLAAAQVLLGVRSKARWLRLVPAALPGAFPFCPGSRRQQAPAGGVTAAQAADPGARRGHRPVGRSGLAGRPPPGGVRPVPPDRGALGPGRH